MHFIHNSAQEGNYVPKTVIFIELKKSIQTVLILNHINMKHLAKVIDGIRSSCLSSPLLKNSNIYNHI